MGISEVRPVARPVARRVEPVITAGATELDATGAGNAFAQEQIRRQQAALLAAVDTGQVDLAAPKSAVWRLGYRDGMAQGKGGLATVQRDLTTLKAINGAAGATGVAADDLTAMSIIESSGNRNVGTNRFGYTGLMQMGRDSASDVGMSYASLQGGANVANNALAGAKYWQINDRRLDEEIPRDPLHMYLAHQQGAGGTNTLMKTLASDPSKAATRAQRNNLPPEVRRAIGGTPSHQDFYDYWSGKMEAIQDAIATSKHLH